MRPPGDTRRGCAAGSVWASTLPGPLWLLWEALCLGQSGVAPGPWWSSAGPPLTAAKAQRRRAADRSPLSRASPRVALRTAARIPCRRAGVRRGAGPLTSRPVFCAGMLPHFVPTRTEEAVRPSPVTCRSLDLCSLRRGDGPKGTPHLAVLSPGLRAGRLPALMGILASGGREHRSPYRALERLRETAL